MTRRLAALWAALLIFLTDLAVATYEDDLEFMREKYN